VLCLVPPSFTTLLLCLGLMLPALGQQPLQTLLVGIDQRAVTSLNGDWHYLVDQAPGRALHTGNGGINDGSYAFGNQFVSLTLGQKLPGIPTALDYASSLVPYNTPLPPVRLAFERWLTQKPADRVPLTQAAFQRHFGISEGTLTKWKREVLKRTLQVVDKIINRDEERENTEDAEIAMHFDGNLASQYRTPEGHAYGV
jgi:hypothetical protein